MSSSSEAAERPKEKTDQWDESEINAAVDVLERPSQIPVPSPGPNAAGTDDAEDLALPRERPASALSASSVEKSRRSGVPPSFAQAQQPVSLGNDPSQTIGDPRDSNKHRPSEVARQSETTAVSPTQATADEAEEATLYYDRTRLQAPDAVASPGKGELDEETRYRERVAAVPRDLVAAKAGSAKADSAKTNALTVRAAQSDVARGGATKTFAAKSETPKREVEAEEPTQFWERPTASHPEVRPIEKDVGNPPQPVPSRTQAGEKNVGIAPLSASPRALRGEKNAGIAPLSAPPRALAGEKNLGAAPLSAQSRSGASEVNAGVVPPPVPTQSGAAAGGPSSWSVERQSSVSLGIGIGILSSDAPKPTTPPVKSVGKSTEGIGTGAPGSSKVTEPHATARSLPSPPRPEPARVQGQTAKNEPKPQPGLLAIGSSSTHPLNEDGAKSALSRPIATPLSAASGIVESSAIEPEPTSERSDALPGGMFELPAPGGMTGITAFSVVARPGSPGFEEEAWLDPFMVRAGRRLLCVAASCVFGALLLFPLDAWFAQRAAPGQPSWFLLALVCAGLSTPVAILLAVTVAGVSMLLHPDAAPILGRLPSKLRSTDARRRARLGVILALTPIASSCWVILVARAALPLLGSNAPAPVVGSLLAAATIGLGLLMAAPILAAARYLGVRLREHPPDPIRWALIGLAIGALPLVIAIATGPTSGAGSTLAVFGVFKRPELDLRAPGMLLAIALSGYLLPYTLRNLRWVWLLAFILLPLGATYRAGTNWLDTRAIALAVERGAPLSRLVLPVARRMTDRDHDGFSRAFGGGDCDDRNASRNPGADDVPGNGVDEDCSGADAVEAKIRTNAAAPAEILRERRAGIPERLNVILIIVDTMRADTLRHPNRVTPRIDELSEKSVIVDNAYAPASYTGKSVGPLLIGKHSSETNRDFSHFSAFSKKDTFVQQRLKAAGIRTLSVQGYWYFHQPLYGFDRGFDVIDSEASTAAGYVEGDRSSTTEKLTDRVLAQLEKEANTSGRFFLWSQYTDPHAEYVWHAGFEFGPQPLGKYHGEVAFVDHHVGRILDFVRSKPWGTRTAIIVSSDHGEAFNEHAMIRHGFELWEPLVRVPLVMYVPGVAARRIQSRRTLVDLVPTILDLMQVGLPDGNGTDFVSGQSMLPEMLGIEGADQSRPVLVDMAQGPYTAERQAFISGDYKLITAQNQPLGLFNLATDPGETHDLLDDVALRERIVGEFRAYKKAMRVVEVKRN